MGYFKDKHIDMVTRGENAHASGREKAVKFFKRTRNEVIGIYLYALNEKHLGAYRGY